MMNIRKRKVIERGEESLKRKRDDSGDRGEGERSYREVREKGVGER